MYAWTLIGYDVTAAELLSGFNDVLADAMRAIEERFADRSVFACRIVEVVRRISVFDLADEYQPTGRTWFGRRTPMNTVRWAESFEPGAPLPFRMVAALRLAHR